LVKKAIASATVKIPENVEVKVDGRRVSVKGPLGKIDRDFNHTPVTIRSSEGQLNVEFLLPDKKMSAMTGTVSSHIKNMITGVVEGFDYKLKIVFAHFPISVKVEKDEVLIENFHGERKPRIAKIQGTTKVTVQGDDVIVQGIDLQDVSQTAANIQLATRIKKKDPRVFLDGVYIFERKGVSVI
jgi:large subunit ribosomal protein L6